MARHEKAGLGPAAALAGTFAVTGVIHLLRPAIYDPIIPKWVPGPARLWTIASGVAELGLAALVADRRTRDMGGVLSAVFLVAVFPANVRTVHVVRRKGAVARAIAWARLPLQVPLIGLALRAAEDRR